MNEIIYNDNYQWHNCSPLMKIYELISINVTGNDHFCYKEMK